MKTAFLIALGALMIAGAQPLFAGVDPMQVVTDYFTPRPGQRMTGKATLVHTVFKKAISEEEWEKGNHFASDQEKAQAKLMLNGIGQVDFTQKGDQVEYEVMQVMKDHAMQRKNILKVTQMQAQACKSMADVARLFKESPPDAYAYDGARTITLLAHQPAGDVEAFVNKDKIGVPEFWRWGAPGAPDGDKVLSMIRDKKIKASAVEQDGLVHATVTMGSFMTLQYVIDPKMDDSVVEFSWGAPTAKAVQKTLCGGYVQVPGGRWYPMDYRVETHVMMNDKDVLVKLDEYRAIPGSVEIDKPLPADAFVVKLAPGTRVNDMRSNPSVTTIIAPGKDRFEGR